MKKESGLSLLEVLITLSILVVIVFSVSKLLRSSFDVRFSLSEKDKLTSKMNMILMKINTDLSHAYIVSSKESLRTDGKKRTIFKIDKEGGSDILAISYTAHKPRTANAKEGDTSYVVYMLKDSKKYHGRKNLYRGEFPRIPDSFKENPNMQLLAKDIKVLRFEPWNGDSFIKDKWDSTQGDQANIMPHMVRVIIQGWLEDPIEGGSTSEDDPVEQYATVIYLPYALDYNEMKTRVTSFKIETR